MVKTKTKQDALGMYHAHARLYLCVLWAARVRKVLALSLPQRFHFWQKKRAICILVSLKMFQAIKLIWILGKRQPEQSQNACMEVVVVVGGGTIQPCQQVSKICIKSCRRCSDLKINSKSSPDLWHPREQRVEPLSPTERSLVDLLNRDRPAYNSSVSYQQLIQQALVQHI